MKRIITLIIIIAFFACEKIEGPYTIIEGCRDASALNFDSLATVDDSCCYISGCMDSLAINYVDSACMDSTQGDSCIFPESWNCKPEGCVDPGDGTGEFTTQTDCENQCDTTVVATWNCNLEGCVDPGDGTGEFTTQTDCENQCDTTVIATWNCNLEGCVDPGDGTGEFSTEEECYNSCDTSNFSSLQKILIEDFTGHKCPNCPEAAVELEAIEALYGDRIIGMAIHGEHDFSRPYPLTATKYTYDFRTTWGKDIDNFFGMAASGLPKGLINRTGYPSNHMKTKDEWIGEVESLLDNNPKFGIKIQQEPNFEDPVITIRTKVFEETLGDYNIVVCLTENDVINWQKDGQNDIENYEHKHVLRSILSSSWGGESLKITQLIEGEIITHTYSFDFNNLELYNIDASNNTNTLANGNGNAGGWNKNNMHLVAYIYDVTNYEIMQVEQIHLQIP